MTQISDFSTFKLISQLVQALSDLGYERPTPVQEASIPVILSGEDCLVQAQTGTGKTAAFALPILSGLNQALDAPQALVIAPTRELAIQVAEAFQSYAKHLPDFRVCAIYGGQEYRVQLRALKRGAHVVVGTPGRVMDHMRRGTLSMDHLQTVVLDEADEMLRMGFVDDVEWVLSQIPHQHQVALFSATMPKPIEQIAKRYLKNAKKVCIASNSATVDTIEQFYTRMHAGQKLDCLTRFLEVESITAVIIFVRTKHASSDLAKHLQARGYAAAALNGDMNQASRKEVVDLLRAGEMDIVVATDVAARGIDVSGVTHVINYDMPHDAESYVHRIGRTGRAGRKGRSILFVAPREQRLLEDLERAINKPIAYLPSPTIDQMKQKRLGDMIDAVAGVLDKSKHLAPFHDMIAQIIDQSKFSAEEIAAALAYLIQQTNPLPTHDLEMPAAEMSQGKRSSRSRNHSPKKNQSQKSSHAKRPSPWKETSGTRSNAKKETSGPRSKAKKETSGPRSKAKHPGKPSKPRPASRKKAR